VTDNNDKRSETIIEYRVTQLEKGQIAMRVAQEHDKNEIIGIIKEHNSEVNERLDDLSTKAGKHFDLFIVTAAALTSLGGLLVAIFKH